MPNVQKAMRELTQSVKRDIEAAQRRNIEESNKRFECDFDRVFDRGETFELKPKKIDLHDYYGVKPSDF